MDARSFRFIKKNRNYERENVIKGLIELQYKRNDQNFQRGTFRVRGENIEIFPSHLEDRAWKLSLDEGKPLNGNNVYILIDYKFTCN